VHEGTPRGRSHKDDIVFEERGFRILSASDDIVFAERVFRTLSG
jgi:hypothetical protein